jgi:TonB family protein
MGTRLAGRRIFVWLMALAPIGLAAADAGPAEQTGSPESSTEPLNAKLNALRGGIWNLYDWSSATGRDDRGRTIADDLRQHVLTATTMANLRSLCRETDGQRGIDCDAAASEQRSRAQQILSEEQGRFEFIYHYWWDWWTVANHRRLWQRILDRTGLTQLNTPRPLVEMNAQQGALSHAFASQMDPPKLDNEALKIAFEALIAEYNQDRVALAEAIGTAQTRRPLTGRDRIRPCPARAPRTSGNPTPKLIKSVSVAELYPVTEKRSQIEGKVMVLLHIDEAGCMRRVEVQQDSGSDGLNEAALDGSELLEYLPAEKDGHAVASRVRLQWVFRLE